MRDWAPFREPGPSVSDSGRVFGHAFCDACLPRPVTGGDEPSPEREKSLPASLAADREQGSRAACDPRPSYDRDLGFPRPDCPSRSGPVIFWWACRGQVRAAGRCHRVFVPRAFCGRCRVTHGLLSALVLVGRRDVAETAGHRGSGRVIVAAAGTRAEAIDAPAGTAGVLAGPVGLQGLPS